MFGFTKLSPEEKALHEKKKRIEELEASLLKETQLRQESLQRSEALRDELETISKG